MQTQAEAAITNGASVLIIDALDSGSGAAIEANAVAKGVKVIDYDRLTLNGSASYYVSFDNVAVGKMIGQGFAACVTAWNVSKPEVLVMDGDPTDNNATLFSQGYHTVLDPKFSAGTYSKVAEPAGTWDNQKALTNFPAGLHGPLGHQRRRDARMTGWATPWSRGSRPSTSRPRRCRPPARTQPCQGLQNILSDYQCMTVYKPIYLEAQAAAAQALFLRAGQKPSSALVNKTTNNKTTGRALGPAAHPGVGEHAAEHERHRGQGRLRPDVPALRRQLRRRLQGRWDHQLATSASSSTARAASA